jgi:hypothetical protein
VSCGAKIEELKRWLTLQEELERRYQQEGFGLLSFGVSIAQTELSQAAPQIARFADAEGAAQRKYKP